MSNKTKPSSSWSVGVSRGNAGVWKAETGERWRDLRSHSDARSNKEKKKEKKHPNQPNNPPTPPSLPPLPPKKIKLERKQRIQKTVSPPSPQAQSLTRLQMSRVQWNEEERWDTDGGILGLRGYKSEHYGGQLSACRSFKKGGPQVNSAHLLNSK